MEIVGGSGVPNRKRVAPVGDVIPASVVSAIVVADVDADVPAVVVHVVCDPLSLGGRSALDFWRSTWPVSAGLKSSSMYSS